MSITEFLMARIAEDEAEIGTLGEPDESAGPNGIGWAEVGAISEVLMCSQHRALRECEAKRRIVDEHTFMAAHESRDFGFSNGNCLTCRVQGPCATLLHLASVYADHPDFRDEWKP